MISPTPAPVRLAGNPSKSPQFNVPFRRHDGKEISAADPRATRALVSLMDMNAVLGGAASHYGGPAALAELMSALHAIMFDEAERAGRPWHELFHFVNDAGHCENGLYALKANYGQAGLTLQALRGFRSIDSKLTGHGEAHLFPEGVLMSNGPLGSAFPQSQGLAMGEALAGTNRVTCAVLSDGGAMEGEAKEAMAAIPGLASAGRVGPYVLIISDNNTKLTGRIDEEAFSMEPTFKALETLGWKVLSLKEGNDLGRCGQTLEEALKLARTNPRQPVAIHARTIKGIGTKKTAESSSGGHGFPLKSPTELSTFLSEIYGGEKYPVEFDGWIDELCKLEADIKAKAVKDTGEKIQKGVAAAMIRARGRGLPVVSVTSDLPGSTGVGEFRKAHPEASIDVGVAESNMISTAAGLSKVGYIPVVDTFAQFGVTKGALPITMASLSQAPVIGVFSHTGFQDAADGASHQALSYFAMLASIPDVELYSLSCSEEAEALMTQAFDRFSSERKAGRTPPSMMFFLGRENFPKTYGPVTDYKLDRYLVLKRTSAPAEKSVCLALSGSLIPQGMAAASLLEGKGYGVTLIHPSLMNRFDETTMVDALKACGGRLVTAEDHQVGLGWGSFIAHRLSEKGASFRLRSLGVHGHFGQSAYNAIDLYRKHGMDASAIVEAGLELLKGPVSPQ